jgi:hypothetical protein
VSGVDPFVHHLLRLGAVTLFASAAIHKLRHPASFRSALADYQLLPGATVTPASRAIPWLELCAAAALLIPAATPLAAFLGVALLLIYALAIGVNLIRGRREIDCGCGLAGGARPLGVSLLRRDVALVQGLLALLLPVAVRSWSSLDTIALALATGTVVLLYAAIDVALANSARQREVV